MPNAKSVSNSNSNNLSNSNNQNNAHSSPKDMLIDEETNRVINQIETNDVVNNDVVNYILRLHRDATLQHHWVQDSVDINGFQITGGQDRFPDMEDFDNRLDP